jgi:hypothetical protein
MACIPVPAANLPLVALYKLSQLHPHGHPHYLTWLWPATGGLFLAILEAIFNFVFIFHYPWWTLPLAAYFREGVTCVDGVDWEYHMSFGFLVCANSLVYLNITEGNMRRKGPIVRIQVFTKYTLALLDMYTDCCFISIATQCGTWHGTYAFYCFVIGVLTFQWLFGVLGGLYTGGFFFMSWNAYLYPAECWMGPDKSAKSKKADMDVKAKDDELIVLTVLKAVAMSICEDLPQAYIQYRFTQEVKKNSLVMISIGMSVLTCVYNIFDAFRVTIYARYY